MVEIWLGDNIPLLTTSPPQITQMRKLLTLIIKRSKQLPNLI